MTGIVQAEREPQAAAVRAQLERILASVAFREARRPSRLLRFLVEETLAGRAQGLKEHVLGVGALDRGPDFDPRTDPVARVEASRLRTRLEQYYAQAGSADEVVISLPRGGYVPHFALQAASTPVESSAADAVPASGERRRGRLAAAAIGATALLAAVALLLPRIVASPESPAVPALHVEIDHGGPADVEIASEVGPDFALDARGRFLVFVGRGPDGASRLFVRALDELVARELTATRGARGPFLSPDARWVAYWADGALWRTRLDGSGRPRSITATADLLGASWTAETGILAALSPYELTSIDPESGATRVVSRAEAGQRRIWPQELRPGVVLVTTDTGQTSNATLEVLEIDTGQARALVRGTSYARYANGRLFYISGGTLFAVRFDPHGAETRGDPIAVARDVAFSSTFGNAQFAAADDGTLVYRRNPDATRLAAAWLDADGGADPLPLAPDLYQWPRLSPDGKRLAVALREGDDFDLWIHELDTGRATRLVDADGDVRSPVWTPDGTRVVYGTSQGLGWSALDGSRGGVVLPTGPHITIAVPWSFAPDGRHLAFYARGPRDAFDLFVAELQVGDDTLVAREPLARRSTPAFEVYPTFSPDGRWLAFASNESGGWEVYVRAQPDDGSQVQVSRGGGRVPTWSRDGRTLVYSTDDRRVMAVDYEVREARFEAGVPRLWTAQRLGDTGVIANYDLTADGRIFALLGTNRDSRNSGLVLVTGVVGLLAGGARPDAHVIVP